MKLNLGSGSKIVENYINVDKFDLKNVEIIHDLEVFPYPFEDNSVENILLNHVLEHLGQSFDVFNNILKEFYRICKNEALIEIRVPHPRHDDYLSDPTHVRPITPLGLSLYDQEINKVYEEQNAANTPLGIIHNLNFKILSSEYVVEPYYLEQIEKGEISREEFELKMKHNFNIIKETKIVWKVIK